MEKIKTERLLLRPFQAEDFADYYRILSDPDVTRYLGAGTPYNRIKAWREFAMLIGHWQIKGYGFYAVQLPGKDALIGRVGLFQPDGWPGMELGWLLDKAHWKKGYATEAAQAVAQEAFKDQSVRRLYSYIHPDNEPSIRVAKRIGAKFDRPIKLDGINVLQYQLVSTS